MYRWERKPLKRKRGTRDIKGKASELKRVRDNTRSNKKAGRILESVKTNGRLIDVH